jgi:hypothetical protein
MHPALDRELQHALREIIVFRDTDLDLLDDVTPV